MAIAADKTSTTNRRRSSTVVVVTRGVYRSPRPVLRPAVAAAGEGNLAAAAVDDAHRASVSDVCPLFWQLGAGGGAAIIVFGRVS
jgi:hypothetical protein